ncbi:pre-piRNA 3'-exonuclease trimmer-like isoform X2 [Panulirus ornatus]|uniref:pre-piRNA 3'-exonuclease trimmer-like isoform X2 n=1 Tax=Panulirus ornatus TaxID=150431 RepID=UPI003A899C56
MVDVTNDNFDHLLPQILADLKSASYVAVDTEFTGLLADNVFKGSLFDDGSQRYQKLCSNIRKFTICQLGLAAFKGVPNVNAYSVRSYNFYLCPQSCLSFDSTFMCQTSSIEFLKRFNFDFNKWLYDGLSFMNAHETEELRRELLLLVKGNKAVNLPYEVQEHLSNIGEWTVTANEGDTTTASVCSINSQVLLKTSIHNRFQDLWAREDNRQVVIQKVSALERTRLQAEDPEGIEYVETNVRKMLGFTTIFHYLTELQKPLVLHNSLLDLMLIYKQFHQNLPESYEVFKSDLHKLFPIIYDTKFIATELKHHFRDKDEKVSNMFSNTGLVDLASTLRRSLPVMYRPLLSHDPPGNKYDGDDVLAHEAGFDAYLTGLSFLSMAHLYAMLQMPSITQHRPMSPREHVYALKKFANCVQIQRAAVRYVNLIGQDPKSKQPPWLLIEGQHKSVRVSPGMVATELAQYGHLDIKPHNNNSVLVAATSWKCINDILMNLEGNSHMKVKVYRRLRHSTLIRTLSWSGALVSAGLSAWLVYTTLKKQCS